MSQNNDQTQDASMDVLYEALRNKDLADCVVVAAQVLTQANQHLSFEQTGKSALKAYLFGLRGKEAFYEKDYLIAFVNFNLALMYAPHNSEIMTRYYFSRAVLMFGAKQFEACVKDINTCLALDCNAIMINNLKKMKAEASRRIRMKRILNVDESCSPFDENFFTLKGSRNPDVPCATLDVEVVMESGQPKVVAARDIPVGTVVAIETAFAVSPCTLNIATSCYYCLKLDLNLKPCEECCAAMFCDKKCKDKAMQEGHNFVCKILAILKEEMRLPFRATFKMLQLCSSWDEFITASKSLGVERMKNNTVSDIFGGQKFSLLNCHNETHFIYGAMFNRCTYFANFINYFDTCTSFLPNSPNEKSAAIQAVSRILMHLSLYCTPVQLKQSSKEYPENNITWNSFANKGYFPFIGSLSNSCLPNSYVIGLRNSAALVTIAPIKKGDKLTISYIGHWLDIINRKDFIMRAKKIFDNYRIVCEDCIICSARADDILFDTVLNEAQMKVVRKFSNHILHQNCYETVQSDYTESCNVLRAMGDMPCATEYKEGFEIFTQCVMYFALENPPNVTFSSYE